MEWQTNPMLREEIAVVRRVPRAMPVRYAWRPSAGVWLLVWNGETVGAVYPGGRYWLRCRHCGVTGAGAAVHDALALRAA